MGIEGVVVALNRCQEFMALVCENPLSGWMDFFKFLRFDVGNGTSVKFWEDEWCRNCSLKVAFLELYSFSWTKESLISKVMWFFDGRLHWDI